LLKQRESGLGIPNLNDLEPDFAEDRSEDRSHRTRIVDH
jgi:hypothetical protein